MTPTERLREAEFSVASPTPILFSAVRAAFGPKQPEGYGLRFGSVYAENFIAQAIEQGAAYKLHEDNRYWLSGKRNPAYRLGYAVSSALVARRDDGTTRISISAIGGAASAAFISRTWQPRSRTSGADAAVSFGLTMAVRASFNVVREFVPRVCRISLLTCAGK